MVGNVLCLYNTGGKDVMLVMIQMGEQLSACRLAKGMTQEQVGEALGVSAQAVSRWESDVACPEVSLLAGLAMLYDTTVDALLGMAEWRSREKLNAIHGEVQRLMEQGCEREAEELIRESLRIYPNNSGLLVALGQTLARGEQLDEAIAVAERVLRLNDVGMKACCTTTVNLVLLYRKAGRMQEAEALLAALPHVWESREMLRAELAEDRAAAMKGGITAVLTMLCRKIDDIDSNDVPDYVQLGMELPGQERAEAMIERIGQFLQS